MIKCTVCKKTFKSVRAFEAHSEKCVAELIGTKEPTLEELMAAYNDAKDKKS